MGVGRLGSIAERLTDGGLGGATPVAVVQWGTTARQRRVRTTLAQAEADVAAAGLAAPAIIVVGAVAGLEAPGLDWFTTRPLFGRTVLVTRTRHQASTLAAALADLGARVLEAPTIELEPPDDWAPVDAALRDVAAYDWLVLTSVNGVAALADRLATLGLDARHLASVKLAAIGEATARVLAERLAIRADLVPTRYVAESLAAELIADQDVARQRFLMLRADIARPALARKLTEAGAEVADLPIYRTRRAAALPDEVLEVLQAGELDWVTFTSSSTATNLVELLGERRELLGGCRLGSIGPITSRTMRELGLEPTVEAEVSTIEGLVAALVGAEARSS
jgi:uroporphyrinogen III methyltransferase/synthase